MRLPSVAQLAPLRLPGFRNLFYATLASSVGTLVAAVALAIDVQARTGSGLWVGAVLVVEFLPTIVVGLLLGPLLDRLERRTLMIAADLLRAGSGLNPSVTSEFFALSPETARFVAAVKGRHGRVFSCDIHLSPSYLEARLRRGVDHESLTFAAYEEMLTPDFNVPFGVRSALSIDRTMLVPEARVASPEEARCADVGALVPRLRAAGVSHVLSLDPLEHAALRPLLTLEPRRIAPLRIEVYELQDAAPYAEVRGAAGNVAALADRPGALDLEVEAGDGATLVVREAHARGWSATLDGRPVPLAVSDGRHLSVALPPGKSTLRLRYRMPLLVLGAALSAVAALACSWLLRTR